MKSIVSYKKHIMVKYKNIGGNSGVESFEIESNLIRVKFKGNSRIYQYSYRKAGKSHVENMKSFALKGSGLNRYIKSYVNNLYD